MNDLLVKTAKVYNNITRNFCVNKIKRNASVVRCNITLQNNSIIFT